MAVLRSRDRRARRAMTSMASVLSPSRSRDGPAPLGVHGVQGLGIGVAGSRFLERRRGRRRARRDRAQECERRPPADALPSGVEPLVAHRIAAEPHDPLEERPVARVQLVGVLGALPGREWGVRRHVAGEITAPPLDEVLGDLLALAAVRLAREIVGEVLELRVEETEKRTEGLAAAAVRRRGDQDQGAAPPRPWPARVDDVAQESSWRS